jgi:hypothetical protein
MHRNVSRGATGLMMMALLWLSACTAGSGSLPSTAATSTTPPGPTWDDDAFQNVVAYCQATRAFSTCASFILGLRDTAHCTVEAVYRVIDELSTIENQTRRTNRYEEFMVELDALGECQLG